MSVGKMQLTKTKVMIKNRRASLKNVVSNIFQCDR